jgi:hypothetical protein
MAATAGVAKPLRWGGSDEMGELEATMWRAGKHPENSAQGAVMEVLDSAPDWDTVLRLHTDRLDLFPRFRQRVVESAIPIGPPVWVDDKNFDLDYRPISTVLFSYNGQCHVGVDYDEDVFGSSDQLLSCLQAGIQEVLDLRHHEFNG